MYLKIINSQIFNRFYFAVRRSLNFLIPIEYNCALHVLLKLLRRWLKKFFRNSSFAARDYLIRALIERGQENINYRDTSGYS